MDQDAYFLQRVITSWIQAAGVFVAMLTFLWSVLRSRKQYQLERYEDINARWVDYLRACREEPGLDVSPFPKKDADRSISPERAKEQVFFFELLLMGERAFILGSVVRSCADLDPHTLRDFLRTFVARPVFREVFQTTRGWFDKGYVVFIEEMLKAG